MAKPIAIVLMIVVTLVTTIAQILYKVGIDDLSFTLISILTNIPILTGLALYGLGAVLMITALKYGEVSKLYPIVATSYIWVAILSMILFNEHLTPLRWAGILVIIIGITLINTEKQKVAA